MWKKHIYTISSWMGCAPHDNLPNATRAGYYNFSPYEYHFKIPHCTTRHPKQVTPRQFSFNSYFYHHLISLTRFLVHLSRVNFFSRLVAKAILPFWQCNFIFMRLRQVRAIAVAIWGLVAPCFKFSGRRFCIVSNYHAAKKH